MVKHVIKIVLIVKMVVIKEQEYAMNVKLENMEKIVIKIVVKDVTQIFVKEMENVIVHLDIMEINVNLIVQKIVFLKEKLDIVIKKMGHVIIVVKDFMENFVMIHVVRIVLKMKKEFLYVMKIMENVLHVLMEFMENIVIILVLKIV